MLIYEFLEAIKDGQKREIMLRLSRDKAYDYVVGHTETVHDNRTTLVMKQSMNIWLIINLL